jgi:hypothetical protein
MILGIYGIFRTWNNRTLIKITTGLNNVENKALLIEFLHLRKYYIYSESKNYIVVVEEESMSVEDLWTKHFIFIINNNEILFNVQKHYPKLNPPVFFTHIFLRRDLKSFIDRKLKSR